jgi:hypothetical protein
MSNAHASDTNPVSESFLTGDVRANLSRYARHRYLQFWRNTVRMDWFKICVYPSPDTKNIRDLDYAGDIPDLAALIAKASGTTIDPQDLLVGIGDAMTSITGASDPDLWAAIDVGQFVCHLHYNDDDANWEYRVILLAGAAITAFAANEALNGAVFLYNSNDAFERRRAPKIHRLVDYLIWIAAGEKHLGPGHVDRSEMAGQFRSRNPALVALLERAADAALATSSLGSSCGPLTTDEIAERGHVLVTEVLQHLLPMPLPRPLVEQTKQRLASIDGEK